MSELPHEPDVARCLAVLSVARRFPGITLDALSKKTHVARATLERDLLDTLMFCGIPPYFPHQYVTVSLDEDRVTVAFADQFDRPVSLTPFEALALKVAVESMVAPGAEPPPVMKSLVAKVEGAMGPASRAAFQRLAESVDARGAASSSLTQRLVTAAATRHVIAIDYLKLGSGVSTRRHVEPYSVLEHSGIWYVAARDPEADAVKAFRVDRILAMTVLESVFRVGTDWNPEAFVGSMARRAAESLSRRCKVRFYGSGVRWIEENADAASVKRVGITAVWTTSFDDVKAFATFLLGSGVRFEVIEPIALAKEVRATAQAIARIHTPSQVGDT